MDDVFRAELLSLYKEYVQVRGPYFRKDGRQHLCLVSRDRLNNGKYKKTTLSYPKAIMEVYLGRRLDKHETVDHIDKNFSNNRISNLQILKRSEHASLDAKRRKELRDNCYLCGTEIILTKDQLRRGKVGVFCSKSCIGKYFREVQLGIRKPDDEYSRVIEYYTNKQIENLS